MVSCLPFDSDVKIDTASLHPDVVGKAWKGLHWIIRSIQYAVIELDTCAVVFCSWQAGEKMRLPE